MLDNEQFSNLRRVINENLRVQKGGADPVPYINVSSALGDISARQNHTVFGRRGCGKTLLLQHSSQEVDSSIKTVYLNCEDFKHHTFPNVLTEILDSLFAELEVHLSGWFGKKKKSKELIKTIRFQLSELLEQADEQQKEISENYRDESEYSTKFAAGGKLKGFNLSSEAQNRKQSSTSLEMRYDKHLSKLDQLNNCLPSLKREIAELFQTSSIVKTIFIQLDDYYHLSRIDQPYIADYVHRLCKGLPLFFKIATLRHTSTLYADREGQPIGVQERHDYQAINIDYTFADYKKTRDQNYKILLEFGKLANLEQRDIDSLFRGEGFDRLIMAGGGVPRDCLSLFLEVIENHQSSNTQIGKDDIRILSRSNFERRIE